MTMNERRAEIMRILTARRSITMPELARTFQVTTRTIQNDVVALTVDYPLETQQGKGGCVKVAQWYHPHRNILSGEQQRVLAEIIKRASQSKTWYATRPRPPSKQSFITRSWMRVMDCIALQTGSTSRVLRPSVARHCGVTPLYAP